LQQDGRRVKATVLDVSQSNAFINEMPVMKVTVDYSDGNTQCVALGSSAFET